MRYDHLQVLIVDDDSGMREALTALLSRFGFRHITQATDVQPALRQVHKAIKLRKPFDLILVDMMMPVGNGINFVQSIRKIESMRHTPIILLTGYSDKDTASDAIQAGVTSFITKPFSNATLEKKIADDLQAAFGKKAA